MPMGMRSRTTTQAGRQPSTDSTPQASAVSFWSCMLLTNGTTLVGRRRLEPWLHDGNVVLSVDGSYFRVHQVVLSSASRVFHEMLSSHQTTAATAATAATMAPKSPERKVDGCPVVTLHDSPPELQIVLKTLYTRPQRIPADVPMHVSVLTAFLRLGKKYEIRWLFDEACLRVQRCYPSSLFSLLFLPPDLGKCPVAGRDKYDFQLINLAREFGIASVLPVAMYRCVCASPLSAILDGYYHDGVVHRLSPANQKACIMGRDKLLELRALTFGWLRRERPCCTDPVKCALGNMATIAELWWWGSADDDSQDDDDKSENDDAVDDGSLPRGAGRYRDPFLRWDPRWDARFCSNCMIYCHREIEDGREDAWDRLPSAFGFGGGSGFRGQQQQRQARRNGSHESEY